jgi:hypothetical protein
MIQKREQMWWLAACVTGLLVAAWAAGGFLGPLLAVFIVLFLAGAVLIEFESGDRMQAGDDRESEAETAESEAETADAEPTATSLA